MFFCATVSRLVLVFFGFIGFVCVFVVLGVCFVVVGGTVLLCGLLFCFVSVVLRFGRGIVFFFIVLRWGTLELWSTQTSYWCSIIVLPRVL